MRQQTINSRIPRCVGVFDDRQQYLGPLLAAGDVILLISCGFGFEAVEYLEMFEVKQGPFAGNRERARFGCGKVQTSYDR